MKIEISKIKVAARIRKVTTGIDDLAANIREHGLISPIAVMELADGEYQLLAGLRRLRAVGQNGETYIEAQVFPASDAESALHIEYFENEQREPFTYSERMDYARLIEAIEQTKAKERMLAGKKSDDPVAQGPQGSGKSPVIIGDTIGMSGKQYDRATYIAETAPQEIIDELDRGERTIRGTYDELRAKAKRAASSNQEPAAATDSPKTPPPKPSTPPKAANPSPKLPPRISTKIPATHKLSAKDEEAIRKLNEFHAMSPEGKIEELKRQLREQRARAAGAESDLRREKELRYNEVYHLTGPVDWRKRQLEEAYARIRDLEAQHEHRNQ
jgi:ParB family chromosome partitioning protein